MSITAVKLPRQARWSRSLIFLAMGILVALVVTLSLVGSSLAHGTSPAPTYRAPHAAPVSSDCQVRIPGHLSPC